MKTNEFFSVWTGEYIHRCNGFLPFDYLLEGAHEGWVGDGCEAKDSTEAKEKEGEPYAS